jgi:hypothetical protein
MTQKAHYTVSFSSRNFSRCPTNIKAQYYSTFVRSSLENTFTVWSPAKKESISQIKVVQYWAACFAFGDYRRTSRNWTPLEVRRNNARLFMIYRIIRLYQLNDYLLF